MVMSMTTPQTLILTRLLKKINFNMFVAVFCAPQTLEACSLFRCGPWSVFMAVGKVRTTATVVDKINK